MLVTHDPEVGAACDRIGRTRDGKIREDGPMSTPLRTPFSTPGSTPVGASLGAPVA